MISVILPVYRVEKYITACILSVLRQTYRDFEIILVDDGSPDRSAEIALDLLQKDGTVPYQIIHTENRGVSAARNTGLEHATGTFAIMVDSDDVLWPGFLQEYADLICNAPDQDIYSCGFSIVDENSFENFDMKSAQTLTLSYEDAQQAFFDRRIRFLLPTLLFRRAFLTDNAIRFDEAVRYSEDVQFIWRCLAYNRKPIWHSTKKVYNYILHPGSTMMASGIPKIMTGCSGIHRLHEQIGPMLCEQVREQLLMRTYFSMLHGAAKMMDVHSFCCLYDQIQCKPYVQAQAKAGSFKVRLVAATLLFSRKLGYQIMRKY